MNYRVLVYAAILEATHPGYADDIAIACTCISKNKMDGALKIVSQYGRK